MRYWLDFEFIEDGRTIEVISIGLVAEDGRELYLQNQECNFRMANEWVARNVLPHLADFALSTLTPINAPPLGDPHRSFNSTVWRTRNEIARAVIAFCDPMAHGKPEFWGYYADYDWVALCQLFGTMMQLPQGWPMYCRDIKQWCDMLGNPKLPEQSTAEHHALADARWNRQAWEFLNAYKPTEEPNR